MTSLAAGTTPVRIAPRDGGGYDVTVNGVDLAGDVESVQLELTPQRTAVALHLTAGHTLDVEALGDVLVVQPAVELTAATRAGVVTEFLDGVDPEALEEEAAQNPDLGDITTGQAFLAVLRRLAAADA